MESVAVFNTKAKMVLYGVSALVALIALILAAGKSIQHKMTEAKERKRLVEEQKKAK